MVCASFGHDTLKEMNDLFKDLIYSVIFDVCHFLKCWDLWFIRVLLEWYTWFHNICLFSDADPRSLK